MKRLLSVVSPVEKLTGICLWNKKIVREAFLHKSVSPLRNNERLEFLGDAVLTAVASEYVFKRHNGQSEGHLTRIRTNIVNRKNLNMLAKKLNIPDFLQTQINSKDAAEHLPGNTLEALIGAIFINGGYSAARFFIIDKLLCQMPDEELTPYFDTNYKGLLLEKADKSGSQIEYTFLSKTKKDNRDFYVVQLTINHSVVSVGKGFTKRSAEQHAARIALEKAHSSIHPFNTIGEDLGST